MEISFSQKLTELEPAFYPRSIAVVGASGNREKPSNRFLQALLDAKFKGEVYAVNPNHSEVLGVKTYPTLSSIPQRIDYVICCIPSKSILAFLEDCTAAGVKIVQMFTAGFSESETPEGIELETEIVRQAHKGGFRIIGPNCIGVHNTEINMPYGISGLIGKSGTIAFLSQSGGVADTLLKSGFRRGIHFSKMVSFGNGCDLDCLDFLEYFTLDPCTRIIGIYLEGIKEGQRLFRLLRSVASHKPVVLWRGGRTKVGSEAAHSHTAALTSCYEVWSALSNQTGIIRVESGEEMADVLLALQYLKGFTGHNVAYISGLWDGGGGDAVSSADMLTSMGLELPRFSPWTEKHLRALLPPAGSIFRNPLDMGSSGYRPDILFHTLEIVDADPLIDLIMIQMHIDDLLTDLGSGSTAAIISTVIRFSKGQHKPVIIISTPGVPQYERWTLEGKLADVGIPVYASTERAACSIASVIRRNMRAL